MSIVKKKKHVSKKNKKAWRKHCDIKDVEDFLEDQRLEERLGKFETKPDSELFILDTAGADNEQKENETKAVTAKQRKRANLPVTPKCLEILLPSSKVQDPNAKRNHVNPVGTKPTSLSKITQKRQLEKGIFKKKVELSRKNRKMALEKKRKMKQTKQNFSTDLWNTDQLEAKGIPSTLKHDFISTEAVLHNVLTEQRIRSKPPPPKTMITRSAIDTPHPGVSYKPSYEEHQDLLHQVVEHEQKMMKKEDHINRVTTGMFRKITAQQRDDQWRKEMSTGLPQEKKPEDNPPSDSDTDNEYKAINPPVKNKKKDHKARRKQKEQLLEKEAIKQKKIDKKKISDIYRLRKIEGNIKKTEELQSKEKEIRQVKKTEKEATALPHLSAHKTPIKEPDFIEPSSLSGNLRHITTKTNLLRERYESLQRRGAVAAAKLMMKKKKRVKSYYKAGHKVTDQEVDRYMAKFQETAKGTKGTFVLQEIPKVTKRKVKFQETVKVKRGKVTKGKAKFQETVKVKRGRAKKA